MKKSNNLEGIVVRNHRNDIKNELAYFYTIIKNMDIKDSIKNSKVKEHEIFSWRSYIWQLFRWFWCGQAGCKTKFTLGWIELIENKNLYKAVKSLSIEDQIFISYIVKECRTQRELSNIYNIAQQNISKRFNNIIKKLRRFMKL